MTALLVLRKQSYPALPGCWRTSDAHHAAQNPTGLDTYYDTICAAMRGVFPKLGLAA